MISAPLLNTSETAYRDQVPAGQYPSSQSALEAAKTVRAISDAVPNDLVQSVLGSAPLVGGIASALASPMPSLTATVNANPSLRYGDNYLPERIAENKIGGFAVSSGANSNAQQRGQGSPSLWVWVVVGIVAIVGVFAWARRG